MSITFNDLLTDPIYREMEKTELYEIVENLEFKYYPADWGKNGNSEENTNKLYYILQKLKAESEKKPNKEEIKALFEKKYDNPLSLTLPSPITKPEHPITITDQKAREICAKYFNCNPNEIKII